jgi:hypothetical protein
MSDAGGGVEVPVSIKASWDYDGSGAEAATQGMSDYYDSVQNVMTSLGSLTSTFSMLEMMTMRQQMMEQMMESSLLRVSTAQQHYNEQVQKFGPASQQAIAAHAQLEIAHIAEQRAQERINMLQLRSYMEILPVGARIMSTVHSIMEQMLGTQEESNTAQAINNAQQTEGAAAKTLDATATDAQTVATEAQTTAVEGETEAEVAQQAFGGPAGWVSLAAGAAVMAGMAAYTYQQQSQMSSDISKQQALLQQAGGATGTPVGFQSGGIVPYTGMFQLHAGETVSPSGGGGGHSGTTNITIHASPGMDVRALADQVYKHIEFERRRGIGVGQ